MSSGNSIEKLVLAVQELSLARDLETVMRIVRSNARSLTGADGATFVLRDGDHCYYADEDAISPLWKGSRFPMSSCISGWAMLNRQAAVSEDIYKDDRIPIEAYKPTFVKSLAMVPIRTIAPIGAIGNYWAHSHRPTVEEITILQSLADITAVAMENVNVYNELEQRVKDRTVELEFANKELEAFSYSVSHDLRAPLRSVMGYARILEENHGGKLEDSGKQILRRILVNADRMNTLIDDLLEFSRVGKEALNRTEVNVSNLVEGIVRDMRNATACKATIHLKTLFPAQADPNLLAQVWTNLFSNAIKFSSKKENPSIEAGSYKLEGSIVYYVKDNGAGFSMEYASKLFGVFQRLHKASEFEGTGVGLSLAQRIVHRHGGRIWAEAYVEEGATFYFSLPDTSVAGDH